MVNLLPGKYRPESQTPALFREMENFFKNFWEDVNGGELLPLPNIDWSPRLDVAESADAIEVKAELPGLDKKEIEVSLERDLLLIKGEKKQEKEEKNKRFHRIERTHGTFCRAVRLPAAVKPDKIKAAYKDGILTVTLPKTEESKQQVAKISIN